MRKFLLLSILALSVFLRLFWLDRYPPSLYTDEANQGYNAYSILLTGKDEHGEFLPVSLRSFGDWKPSLPTYLMIPFVFIFGLNEYSVRLPSVLFGIGTILLSFYLAREFFSFRTITPSGSRFATPGRWLNSLRRKPNGLFSGGSSTKVALLTSYFLAISPWHILQSRAAMLVMISLFFLELGVYLFLKAKDRKKLLLLSAASFALSIYAYYGMRAISPLIVLFLLVLYKDKIANAKKQFLLGGFVGFVLLLPFIFAFLENPDVVFGRAKTVSVFYDKGVRLRQWELITQDGINYPTVLARFFHNNIYMYGKDIADRFLSHFDGQFLFLVGDQSQPFQIPNMGVLYLLDGLFIIVGIYFIYGKKIFSRHLIAFWLFVSFVPAAFTFMTPSSNRTFTATISLSILTALGVFVFHKLLPKRVNNYRAKVAGNYYGAFLIAVLYLISFGFFLKQYFIILPQDYAHWWGYGMKQVVEYVKLVESKYDNVIMSDIAGMPYIYFLFYAKYDPASYQKEAVRTYVADRFGYEHVESYGKFLFLGRDDWDKMKNNKLKNSLYVIPATEELSGVDYSKVINYPNGKEAFKIFSYE